MPACWDIRFKSWKTVPPDNIYPPQLLEYVSQQVELTNEQGHHQYEATLLRKNGSQFQGLLDVTAVSDETGSLLYRVAFLTDITERKEMERKQQLLMTAIEQSVETMMITDKEGVIQYVNPAFRINSGYELSEALGNHSRLVKSDEHDPDFYEDLWKTISKGGVWSGQICNKKKDGTLYYVDATISPVRNSIGEIENYVAVKHDVTKALALEANYLQAQKMEAIGRLAGGVAHDFGNLLTIISGRAELAAMSLTDDDPTNNDVEEILLAVDRATALTRQLLDFSRQQPIRTETVELNQILKNTVNMLGKLVGENINFFVEIDISTPTIETDGKKLEQVLINLVVNARDAMPDGGNLRIYTSVAKDIPSKKLASTLIEGEYVIISVEDSGIGIEEDILTKIFEPFFTTKPEGIGTGLGLATSYGIINQLGGIIDVKSKLGEGTTFDIYLPITTGNILSSESTEILTDDMPSGTEIILVVEDEIAVRKVTAKILRTLGYTVLEAQSGGDAYVMCLKLEHPPDLVLTDIIMPNLSGPNLVAMLRATFAEIKFVYMSGYSGDEINLNEILATNTPFLQKPFRKAELASLVRQVLDNGDKIR